MRKDLCAMAALCLALITPDMAAAHGTHKARHGGVVATSGDLGFELVATPDGAALYIDDHDKPGAVAGMAGKLTVLHGSEKSEAVLAVVGDKLEAKGVKLAPGAKVVAALTTPAKKAITVRFTVK